MASRQAIDERAGQASRGTRTRWFAGTAMAWRWFTAIVGGYGFAVAAAMLTARILPAPDTMARIEVTGWPMLLSFLVYAGIGLWALHEIRLRRVGAVVWGGAIVMAGLIWWLGTRA
ncbi:MULTISPECIES: hypothetical protein [unclassified Sphingomonas]|uniref:hypothetical protein n=1 Tax=unclassified Sphingomonas TaxID=196159 RepID=UPI002782ABE5|nr:hypothetical protein [Sphingomonas sp. SORGH_AS_0879]MDQ1232339.1 hypothetical protein [Sphingomonas sp. SORGH_AS_0879]